MQQTRRTFMGSAAALAVLATGGVSPVRADPAPVRLSLTTFSQDQSRVDSLRRGVAAMKALPASDHRSWFFQAATHAYSVAAYRAETRRNPRLKRLGLEKYWNKCPHFGQSSADFIIWHRAYLYFFERTLRDMAGDPSLALPYWNYADPRERAMPAIYQPEFLDDKNTVRNPLYHPNRETAFANGIVEISGQIGTAPNTMAAANFFNETGVTGFGGDTLDKAHTQAGLLQQRPHNDIHEAVGGVIGDINGAMAEISTAAFDPVFWVHHTNIDRMWSEWASKPGKRWGPLPPDAWFDARSWMFFDADGTQRSVSRREAMAMQAAYDVDYPTALILPAHTTPVSGDIAALRTPPPDLDLLADSTPIVLAPGAAGVRLFGSAPRHDSNLSYGTQAPISGFHIPALRSASSTVLLELTNITFARMPSSGFAVYLDGPGTMSANLVGLIDLFSATHMSGTQPMAGMTGMPSTGATQRFDVTAIVRGSAGPFTLRIEPYTLLVARDGRAGARRADTVHIGGVRFMATG